MDKTCPDCHNALPRTSAYWYLRDGGRYLSTRCRACSIAAATAARALRYQNDEQFRQWDKARVAKRLKDNRGRTNAYVAKRAYQKKQRIPAWANLDAIAAFYVSAATLTESTGILHHVDHIVPLLGKKVSGLHVETNLRVIPALANLCKGNRYCIG
jgi:hypothetical protein